MTNSQANPLRYSQIESRAKIGTVQSPIKASQAPQVIHGNPSEIRFIIPQQKMVAVQGPNQSVSFNPSQQILQQGRSIEPTSQQFTFKSFNQNPVDNQPHVDNTSFANFSLGPSQSSTQRDRNSLTSQQYTPPINYPSNITIQSAQRELTIPNGTLPSQASGKLQQNRVIN